MFYDRLVFDHSRKLYQAHFLWLLVENICGRAVLRQGALVCPISYVTAKKIQCGCCWRLLKADVNLQSWWPPAMAPSSPGEMHERGRAFRVRRSPDPSSRRGQRNDRQHRRRRPVDRRSRTPVSITVLSLYSLRCTYRIQTCSQHMN